MKEGFFGSLASAQKDYALKTDKFIAQDDKVIVSKATDDSQISYWLKSKTEELFCQNSVQAHPA